LVAIALLVACGDDDVSRSSGIELAIDGEVTRSSVLIIERTFAPDDCALVEGAVPAPGLRRLLTFDVMIVNFGTHDLIVGDPTHPVPPLEPDDFEFSPCHGHFHLSGFTDYELRDGDRIVGAGHKQAFCLADWRKYGATPSSGYDCEFQGISAGWGDLYRRDLDGQWVDITGVPPGTYTLVVTVNGNRRFPETHGADGNVFELEVEIPPA
jgi:hypothetical protein